MNRIIKFRGKRKDNGQWVVGNLSIEYDGSCFISYWVNELIEPENNYSEMIQKTHAVVSETVGQFTGLKDKNGKEIYEGDIVNDRIHKCIVEWNEREAKYNLAIIYEDSLEGIRQTHKHMPLDAMGIEVIGNIH